MYSGNYDLFVPIGTDESTMVIIPPESDVVEILKHSPSTMIFSIFNQITTWINFDRCFANLILIMLFGTIFFRDNNDL